MPATKTPIRIIIADDHAIFLNGISVSLSSQKSISIVAKARNGMELIKEVARHRPDVVLTDIQMPEMDGIQATATLRKKYTDTQVIGLSMFADPTHVLAMMHAGANGYLEKNTDPEELALAVQAVYLGNNYYSPAISKLLTQIATRKMTKHDDQLPFTDTERAIIRYICQEYSSKEISEKLQLSPRTIEKLREGIQKKTNSKNMAGIVMYAMTHKLM
jgi:DNA-binding NarL/FixJ family response regulator